MRFGLLFVLFASVASVSVSSTAVIAETPKTGDSCMLPPLKLPDEEVAAFIADPGRVKRDVENAREGRILALERRVRRLVGSGTGALDAVKTLLETASADEREAIGRALGAAAGVCALSKPEIGLAIQAFVARLDLPDVITAFLARSGDTSPASISGVGPSGGIVVGSFTGGGASPQTSTRTQARPVESVPVSTFGAANFTRPVGSSSSRSRP